MSFIKEGFIISEVGEDHNWFDGNNFMKVNNTLFLGALKLVRKLSLCSEVMLKF